MRDTSSDPKDCLKTLSLDGTLTSMDADGMCVMEIDDFAVVAGKPWDSLWPQETQAQVRAAVAKAAAGKVARFRADCPTAKGTPKFWDVSVSPIRDATGRVVALQSLSLDITQRELDRDETALVSRELTHRLKNLLAVIDGMILLSARGQPQAAGFVDTLRQRLSGIGRAVAFIHPMLDDTGAPPKSLQGLIRAVLAPYEAVEGRVEVSGDDIDINDDALTSIALVLNELTTNAVKYGALRDGDGELTVRLTRNGETLALDWTETGSAALAAVSPAGFGTSLLDRTVERQLGGTIARDWSPRGVIVAIVLPVARLGETPA